MSGFTAAILSISISIRRILNHNSLYPPRPQLPTCPTIPTIASRAARRWLHRHLDPPRDKSTAIDFSLSVPFAGYYPRMTGPRRTFLSFHKSHVSLSLSLSRVADLSENFGEKRWWHTRSRLRSKRQR